MNNENNRCVRIFHELIEKNCIETSQVLEETENCNYFEAKSPNIIQYHPNMKNIDENSIRFCLLHEENHNRHAYWAVTYFLLISVILSIFWNVFHFNIILLILIVIISGIVVKRTEEYACDEFAALTIKNELKIDEQPSEILKKTLEKMPYKWWSAIIHPSLKNRVKNIHIQYDEKT